MNNEIGFRWKKAANAHKVIEMKVHRKRCMLIET